MSIDFSSSAFEAKILVPDNNLLIGLTSNNDSSFESESLDSSN